jgi:hypothetical protein
VWALGVETTAKSIESLLLFLQGECRRRSSVFLQGPIHSLMLPVLLWASRLDPLVNDSEPDPLG